MLNLLEGIIAYCQDQFPDIVGSYLNGNTEQLGPFLNLAPEVVGSNGPTFPYMTIQTFGEDSDLGFINPTGTTTYVEKPKIRFLFWDSNNARVMGNAEAFCRNLDVLRKLPLEGGEAVLTLLRTQNIQSVPQPINRQGKRAYMWWADYRFMNLRILGQ